MNLVSRSLLFLLGGLAALGGCLQADYETTLYPDGSGKMKIQLAIRQSAIQEARRRAGRPGELPMEELQAALQQIQKPEAIKEYMDGVVGWKPLRMEEDATWLRGTYTVYFDDINQFQLYSTRQVAGKSKQLVFSWRLIKSSNGGQTLYQITGLRGLPALKVQPGDQAQSSALAERLRPLFEDLRATLQVTVPGPILETKGVLQSNGRSAGWTLDGSLFLGALRDLEGSDMKRLRDILDLPESRISWTENALTPAQMAEWKKEIAAAKDEWKKLGGAGLSDDELERSFIKAKLEVAIAHDRAGRTDKARKILEDIVHDYPNHRETLAAKELLEKIGK